MKYLVPIILLLLYNNHNLIAQFGEQFNCGGENSKSYLHILSADLNNDDSEELIGFLSDRISIMQHNGPLTFDSPIDLFYNFENLTTANAADVDGDGLIDLIVSCYYAFDTSYVNISGRIVPPGPPMFYALGKIFILKNNGNLSFSEKLLVSNNLGVVNDLEVFNLNDTPELEIIASSHNYSLGIVNDYLPRTSIFYNHTYLDTVPSQEQLLLIDTSYQPIVSNFAVGDWDGDGDKDIVVNSIYDSTLIILDNLQSLNFSPIDSIHSAPLSINRVESTNINLDAYDDLIITGKFDDYNAHLSSIINENGSLHSMPNRIDSLYVLDYADKIYFEIMDLNTDGYSDIVLPYPWLGAFINQQNGQFSAEPQYLQRDLMNCMESYIPHAISNQVKNDVVCVSNCYIFSVGIYQNPIENDPDFDIVYPSCVGYPQIVSADDYTGDFETDLIVHSSQNLFLTLLSEYEDSNFVQRTALAPIAGWGGFQTVDFDNDGDLDLAVETGYYGNVHVALNNGYGDFSDTTIYAGFPYAQYDFKCADVNQDGYSDIVLSAFVVSYGSDDQGAKIGVLLNNGDGTFQPMVQTQDIFMTGGEQLPIDWDNDGLLDLISRNDSGLVWIRNQGGLNWSTAKVIVRPQVYSFPVKCDMNSDGIDDLVYLDFSQSRNLVTLLNLADTNFVAQVLVDSVEGSIPFLMHDLNLDGISDLIIADYQNQTIKYSIIEDGNTQPPFIPISDSTRATNLTLGDINNDGFKDLVGVNPYSNHTFWFYQDPGSPTIFTTKNPSVNIHVAPNPNSGYFRIEGIKDFEVVGLSLYSADGRLIDRFSPIEGNHYSVSSKCSSGIYVLHVETEERNFHLRIMIE